VDKIICHQVGSMHRDTILKALGISSDRDFSTFPFLGNMGTVSLPLTAALAEEREFLRPGDRVGLLGIGSGLNCLMLGVEW
jgi:3-oxoacyl-[acyl-carrier-protein] synthase-3